MNLSLIHCRNEIPMPQMLLWWTLGGVTLGLALGVALRVAQVSRTSIDLVAYPGELLLRALKELVLPLIALALLSGVLSLRRTANGATQIASWTISYYLFSMLLAVALGIALMLVLEPGRGAPFGSLTGMCAAEEDDAAEAAPPAGERDAVQSLLNIGRQLLPNNIISAAANDEYLGIIAFCIFFGAVLSSLGERAEPLIQMIEVANETIVNMISHVIVFTPLGVCSLVAGTVLRACSVARLAGSLALYTATIMAGFTVHGVVVLPITVALFTRRNPFRIAQAFLPAFAVGFGTSSSAAALPVTMECAVAAGCDDSIVKFVIPLGTSVNRDGAALYEAATVLFIAQAHGVPLSVGSMVLIATTATLAAIGAASVPMGALISMLTVLQAVDMQQYAGDLAVILAVDWALGMFRTVLNIWGDCCAVVCVNAWSQASLGDDPGPAPREEEGSTELEDSLLKP